MPSLAQDSSLNVPLLGVALVLSYLLGSVPFGLLLARARGIDLRAQGSGNIGATNVARVVGPVSGLLAFVGDFGKGFVPAFWIATLAGGETRLASVLCGAAAVCGHVWPVYLRFKGGKAVATGCGALVALDPIVFLVGGAAWLVTLFLFRFVGLASMVMAVVFPIAAWVRMSQGRYGIEVVLGASALTALVLLRHRPNIARMISGTEPRLRGTRKKRERHA